MPGENIQDWSTTAATNAAADSSINWAEGQPRASVNNSARSMMAAHAKQRNLQNGSITTTGTANTQAFLSPQGYTSTIPTNLLVRLKIGAGLTNTGAVTLNMDFLADVAIKDQAGNDLIAGALVANSYATFIYNGTNWIWISPTSAATPPAGDNDASIATTAFVTAAITAVATNVRVFLVSGTYPTTTATIKVLVYCKGGGGGGGNATTISAGGGPRGGGGGEGAESWFFTTAAVLSGQNVTIGAGGAAGVDGATGGTTSIGSGPLVTAPGGFGGTRGDLGGAGGIGGHGGTNTWGMPGAAGQFGSDRGNTMAFNAAGGGKGGGPAGSAAQANSGGGGGSGAFSVSTGAGGSGIVVCYEFGVI